jgi:hypothetical protein
MAQEYIEISLAKALKLKNRLAGRLAKLDTDLKTYNSVHEGAEKLDVPGLYEARRALVAHLVDLKLAVSRANEPVQRSIFELAERKALIALLSGLNTRNGTVTEGYPATPATYVAHLRKADVDREVQRLEAEIDKLQDQLDAFNHQTLIRVDANTVAAAGPKPARA